MKLFLTLLTILGISSFAIAKDEKSAVKEEKTEAKDPKATATATDPKAKATATDPKAKATDSEEEEENPACAKK